MKLRSDFPRVVISIFFCIALVNTPAHFMTLEYQPHQEEEMLLNYFMKEVSDLIEEIEASLQGLTLEQYKDHKNKIADLNIRAQSMLVRKEFELVQAYLAHARSLLDDHPGHADKLVSPKTTVNPQAEEEISALFNSLLKKLEMRLAPMDIHAKDSFPIKHILQQTQNDLLEILAPYAPDDIDVNIDNIPIKKELKTRLADFSESLDHCEENILLTHALLTPFFEKSGFSADLIQLESKRVPVMLLDKPQQLSHEGNQKYFFDHPFQVLNPAKQDEQGADQSILAKLLQLHANLHYLVNAHNKATKIKGLLTEEHSCSGKKILLSKERETEKKINDFTQSCAHALDEIKKVVQTNSLFSNAQYNEAFNQLLRCTTDRFSKKEHMVAALKIITYLIDNLDACI